MEPSEPKGPPGMPKNHAPGRCVSYADPPRRAPATTANVATKPRTAVGARRRGDNAAAIADCLRLHGRHLWDGPLASLP